MKSIEFVSLGYCSNDHLCSIAKIPYDSKTEILHSAIQGGGPAANAAVGAARLGLKAAFIGCVGEDNEGQKILADFSAEGVDCSAVQLRQGKKSSIAYCWITPDAKRSIAWSAGDFLPVQENELPKEMIKNAKILHLDGHNSDAAIAAAKIAKKSGVLISLDAGSFTPRIDELMQLADILIASEEFVRRWSKENKIENALLKMREKNSAEITAVTMGAAGSMLLTEAGEFIRCPAYKIDVIDSTGAGDAYHCGFAVKYLSCKDPYKCMRFASAFAALKCRQLGGRAALPKRQETENFILDNKL